jgi:hypothetical protein
LAGGVYVPSFGICGSYTAFVPTLQHCYDLTRLHYLTISRGSNHAFGVGFRCTDCARMGANLFSLIRRSAGIS